MGRLVPWFNDAETGSGTGGPAVLVFFCGPRIRDAC
jgi:hypothetical protein